MNLSREAGAHLEDALVGQLAHVAARAAAHQVPQVHLQPARTSVRHMYLGLGLSTIHPAASAHERGYQPCHWTPSQRTASLLALLQRPQNNMRSMAARQALDIRCPQGMIGVMFSALEVLPHMSSTPCH